MNNIEEKNPLNPFSLTYYLSAKMQSIEWQYALHPNNIYVDFDKEFLRKVLEQMSEYFKWVVVCFTNSFDSGEKVVKHDYFSDIFYSTNKEEIEMNESND